MLTSSVETVAGVCALVAHPLRPAQEFLGLRERTWKRLTNKIPGMVAPPFETVELGESHTDVLRRIFREEYRVYKGQLYIPEDQKSLDEALLCKVQLSPGAWLYAYQIPASADFRWILGDNIHEVTDIGWTTIAGVFNRGDWFEFRPGTEEIVKSYLERLNNPEKFHPGIHPQTCVSVPPELFDLLENPDFQEGSFSLGNDRFIESGPYMKRVYQAMEVIGMNPETYRRRIERQNLSDLFDGRYLPYLDQR